MVKLTHILFAMLVLCANVARADDSDRDRKARVALALTAASTKPAPKSLCACGDACECAAGKCPACPAATAKPAAPAVTYREVWYSDGRRVWRQLEPLTGGEGCPNGRCAIPR